MPNSRVATKKTTKKKPSSKVVASKPRFSKRFFLLFGIIFAAIGLFTLLKIFAATASVHYFGILTSTNPTASYTLTTGTGTMDISFTNNTADVLLTVTNKSAKVMGSVMSIGKTPVKLTFPVVADEYTVSLSSKAGFKGKKGYAMDITYPVKDITSPTAIIAKPLDASPAVGVVEFTALAQDDTGVTKVDLYVDNVLLSSDTTSPYGTSWDTRPVANGQHTLSVKSYDAAGNVGSASASVQVFNSKSRFPGDPNSKITGKAYFGASIGGNGDPTKHESVTGTSLSTRRTFWQWDAAINTSSSMYSTIQDDLNHNRLPFVSAKAPSWADVGNGKYDADLDKILKKLDSYGKPIWFVMNHEPEGGGSSGNTPDDPGGAPAWRAMQSRIRSRMNAVHTTHVAFMPVLMSYTWNQYSGRNPADWWVPGIWDAYIVDHYRDNVSGDMFSANWSPFVAWIEAKGLPYGTAEWGNRGTDATAAAEMQQFWDWSFANHKDVVTYTYFDSGLNSPNGSWELTGEPLNKFHDILKNDVRVQRINDL